MAIILYEDIGEKEAVQVNKSSAAPSIIDTQNIGKGEASLLLRDRIRILVRMLRLSQARVNGDERIEP